MKFESIFKETEENMRLALLSLWAPGNHPMRPAINELLDREPLLSEPVFQSTFGWKTATDENWRNAINAQVWEKLENMRRAKAEESGKNYRPFKPFTHQSESWKAVRDGNSIVVTSGTGSGKTECFMYPVLSDLYEQRQQNPVNAIRAIFLYPLNALMEDQKKRLSDYCQATNLHYAVYNGSTPEYHEDGNDINLPNEITNRTAIRNADSRPDILLTNPSMLEYILVRKRDQQMLQESAGQLRWIVIDEAHSYSGSAAVELAYQIKRVLEAFGENARDVRFACTSATIGGEGGERSLVEFISKITGQDASRISVIGGTRLVPELNLAALDADLSARHLPDVSRVVSLRKQINEVPGMSLRQMWEWLLPGSSYDGSNPLVALRLLDQLCEMSQEGIPVLSLRAHFFMRAISGLYACANEHCQGVNHAMPLYGHITSYKSSVCPDCGAPLLEIVQCKRCGGFVLMGDSDSQTHLISPTSEGFNREDYFSINDSEELEDDDNNIVGSPDTFFILPYNREKFFNPKNNANFLTMDFSHGIDGSVLDIKPNNDGKWVEVRNAQNHRYCPCCGKLAQGQKLNLKHFRIPIDFINQTISPVLLKESATAGDNWGKYIAFTDSRQGTAISAKTFNINVERTQCRERIVQGLVDVAGGNTQDLTDEERTMIKLVQDEEIKAKLKAHFLREKNQGLPLNDVAECVFDESLFVHIADDNGDLERIAYRAALMRQFIGRKSLYENSAESMGLITLVYPALQEINSPNSIRDYVDKFGGNVTDQDWRDFLKIALDYFFRVGNHIQPLVHGEKKYAREGSMSSPVAPHDDARNGVNKWPTVKMNQGNVTFDQHRLVLLLCAGLGITRLEELQARRVYFENIMKDVWMDLVSHHVLTKVSADTSDGYNDPLFFQNQRYVDCYFLDLSGRRGNDSCRIELAREAKICPVTNKLIDTTFCGYSPLMVGEFNAKLFERYKCSEEIIMLPVRPRDNEEVEQWLVTNAEIQTLKDRGLWCNRHKYCYKHQRAYIAAEHSAQQSKEKLREYTREFSQTHPNINVLHCSTTMEMGVDIGDIDIVLMDTVPPTAANYLQRVGRAGRMGQTKAIAFSLCSNTPVGQQAFANPMWALETANHMVQVRESQTIIQRHVNSYFFRRFICPDDENNQGYDVTATVKEFMSVTCDSFVDFLDRASVDVIEEGRFHDVFGANTSYTINVTKESILSIKQEYNNVMDELRAAFLLYPNDQRRQHAISNQIRKLESRNLLQYLSEHQFFPNANMPTGVVTFDFIDGKKTKNLYDLFNRAEREKQQIDEETDEATKCNLKSDLDKIRKKIDEIFRESEATRDIRTALNEYAPGQTVVVNEKNYVSAGIMLFGPYNEQTQTRAIYHCIHCGHIEYRPNLDEHRMCPICGNPYHGILDRDNEAFTLAYEPVGFRTDQNADGTREENTKKHYYDIRPVLLNTDWARHSDVNMCEIVGSGEQANILFYNVGVGHGFAFCKRCGRAAVEMSIGNRVNDIPESIRPGHKQLLYSSNCDANNDDIARHVVFTGKHPTCYSVLRFKKNACSNDYENDEQLAYSLGVVLTRALAKSEGVDENEIDFGIKQERDAWVLFIYDTAKGGCGYSLKLSNPVLCQEMFDIARETLEETTCNCHVDGGACTRCLVDRNNYKNANLLSKAKVLNWLNRQKGRAMTVPDIVLEVSPSATVAYQPLKDIVKQAVDDLETRELTLCVSDLTDDHAIADWISQRCEMGKYIRQAVSRGKTVRIVVEYHPELHSSTIDKLPYINLREKFPDCQIVYVRDMGALKTAIIVNYINRVQRYFTDENTVLSFSNTWGDNCFRVFTDNISTVFEAQEGPSYTPIPDEIVREGVTQATTFQVKRYFSAAIAPYVLQSEDETMIHEILGNKHVRISLSDTYVNSALAGLMLVFLIDEIRQRYGFVIDDVELRLDSQKRKCENPRFNQWSCIGFNFPSKEIADEYIDKLFNNVIGVDPYHSNEDADHHRWLKIVADGGGCMEIRFDHSISGGYVSESKYINLDSLNGTVSVIKKAENVLYYIIIRK